MWLPHFEIMFNSRRTLRVRLACVSGVVVFAAFLIGCSTKPMPTKPATLRVMTYNIHHGEGLDGQVDLLRIAQLIQREGADIVALQEVDKGVARTARRDFPAELAALTGMACVFSNNFAARSQYAIPNAARRRATWPHAAGPGDSWSRTGVHEHPY
jgi:hypothetical protein